MKVSAEHQTPTIFRGGGRGVTTCTPLSFSGVAMWHVILCQVPDSPSPHDGAVCTRAHCCTSARRRALTADTDPTLSILVRRVLPLAPLHTLSPWYTAQRLLMPVLPMPMMVLPMSMIGSTYRTWQLQDAGEDAAALYSLCARAHRTISRWEFS